MRHRISCNTGLGNPTKARLDNVGTLHKQYEIHVRRSYFPKADYMDYFIDGDKIIVGFEPSYMYEKLKIICIHRDKDVSYIETGISYGGYGTNVVSKRKYYRQYKRKCKFVRFIDLWHHILFGDQE